MGQQISLESALEAFRRKCGELFEANVLLEARVADLEAEAAALRAYAVPAEDPLGAAPAHQ